MTQHAAGSMRPKPAERRRNAARAQFVLYRSTSELASITALPVSTGLIFLDLRLVRTIIFLVRVWMEVPEQLEYLHF